MPACSAANCRRRVAVRRENADLRHRRGQGPAAQGFLQRPAHLRIAPRGNQDQPAQIEPEGGEAGGIEIALLRHPGDPTRRCAGLQGQGEEPGSGGALFLIAAMAGDFVDGAEGGGSRTLNMHRPGEGRWTATLPEARTSGRKAGMQAMRCFNWAKSIRAFIVRAAALFVLFLF